MDDTLTTGIWGRSILSPSRTPEANSIKGNGHKSANERARGGWMAPEQITELRVLPGAPAHPPMHYDGMGPPVTLTGRHSAGMDMFTMPSFQPAHPQDSGFGAKAWGVCPMRSKSSWQRVEVMPHLCSILCLLLPWRWEENT